MKTILLASALLLTMSRGTAAEPEDTPPAPPTAAPSLRERLTDEAIRQAVRATLAESPARPAPASSGEVLRATPIESFPAVSRKLKNRPASDRTRSSINHP